MPNDRDVREQVRHDLWIAGFFVDWIGRDRGDGDVFKVWRKDGDESYAKIHAYTSFDETYDGPRYRVVFRAEPLGDQHFSLFIFWFGRHSKIYVIPREQLQTLIDEAWNLKRDQRGYHFNVFPDRDWAQPVSADGHYWPSDYSRRLSLRPFAISLPESEA
jgi:hypothetical protein